MIYGLDLSNWQGAFDFGAHDLSFGIAKATEGLNYRDVQFARNWSQMKAHGMVRGAYHFAHPGNNPTAEADYFLSTVRSHGLQDGDLLALDLEVTDGHSAAAVAKYARDWCDHVHSATGRKPLVYTFISFARNGSCSGLGSYPLWIAAPSYPAGHPPMPLGPWSSWAIHQYADSPFDKDCTHFTKDQLRGLGRGADPASQEDDDMSERISVGASKDIVVPANSGWVNLEFDKVYQDTGGARGKGNVPGIIDKPGWATLTMDGRLESTEPLARVLQVRFAARDFSKKDSEPVGWTWREILGTEGETPIGHTRAGMYLGDREHLYAQVKNMTDKPLTIKKAAVQGTWKPA